MSNPETTAKRRIIQRNKEQVEADTFDLGLYRLLGRAEFFAENAGYAAKRWEEIIRDLRTARARVRGLMHPADRSETSDR